MIKFTKLTAFFVALLLLMSLFLGCAAKEKDNVKIKIMCSVFPEYDWVRSIVRDVEGVEVSLLVSNGQELHSYEASPADVANLKGSDFVISVGGASDKWISEALRGEDVKHIRLTEIKGVKLYETSSESGEHEHSEEHGHEHGQTDEHVWMSLKNAAVIVDHICGELSVIDSENAEKYKENTENYKNQLKELDERMVKIAINKHTLLFADRFPFVYLLEDYGIGYYAAFEGCSSDISWTPDTTVDLAARLDASGEKYLFVTESSDGELADLVIATSKGGGKVLVLNSMQSVSKKQAESESYVGIMSKNIEVLESAFLK
jgi:zinc transport system substrate-binding protein